MARSVYEVEHIALPIQSRVINPHGIGLDRDPTFALNVHAVEHLSLHIPLLDRSSLLNQPVSQRGFTVVNMRHDREIADV